MKRNKPATILVIPDSHACPYFDLERYTRLGKFAGKVKPDYIVSMGDWAEMYSLGKFDVGTVKYEGARYENDIAAANEALDRFSRAYKGKAKKVFLLGNHEARIDIAANKDPKLYGTLRTTDIQAKENGWEVVEFLRPALINGVNFIHYLPNGVGRATSSKHLARKVVEEAGESIVVGHSHTLSYDYTVCKRTSQKRRGLVCGYFGHPDYEKSSRSAWATGGKERWDNCVCILNNTLDGDFSLQVVRHKEVK